MNKWLGLLIAILAIAVTAEEGEKKRSVYYWVNEDGTLVFSDRPVAGAQEVNLKANTQNSVAQQKPLPELRATPEPTLQPLPKMGIELVSPADEQTIRSNTGSFKVQARSSIPVGTTHQFRLYLDGRPYGPMSNVPEFQLRGIERGQHALMIRMYNSQGVELATSQPVTIYLHQASKKFN